MKQSEARAVSAARGIEMQQDFWQKQSAEAPLFPDMLWSRPEHKAHAGKIGVIGGNLHGFAAVGEAYNEALAAGAGFVRALLPIAVKSVVHKLFPDIEYGASNPSGSFGQASLSEWLDMATWSDSVLIAGDVGRNSETAIVMEQFARTYTGPLLLTKDASDYVLKTISAFSNRPNTAVVLTMAQLQKFVMAVKYDQPVSLAMGAAKLAELLSNVSVQLPLCLIVKHDALIFVAYNGQVSTTSLTKEPEEFWRVKAGAHAAVWLAQNPARPFEAVTTAMLEV